jgi:hypothetical protein
MCTMRDITRSYRIRAYPNGVQRRMLDRWFGGDDRDLRVDARGACSEEMLEQEAT